MINSKDEEWEKNIEDAPEQKICNYAGDSSWGTPALFLVDFKLISSISISAYLATKASPPIFSQIEVV